MAIVRCEADLIGSSPLGFNRYIQSKKGTEELHSAFEERSWRERMHVNKDGNVFVPPGSIKNCLWDMAQWLGETVPGKSKMTYTKYFRAGIMTVEEMVVVDPKSGHPIKAADVQGVRVMVPANGKRGPGPRVEKIFPVIPEWKTTVFIDVLDVLLIDKIDKVKEYLELAGQTIGILFWRPINGGLYGRFTVENFKHNKAQPKAA